MSYLQVYGLNGVSNVMPLPIEGKGAPSVKFKNAVIGQEYIDTDTNTIYIYAGTVGQDAVWREVSEGGTGDFSSINVTGPAASIIDGDLDINNATNHDTVINGGNSSGNVEIIADNGTGTITIGNPGQSGQLSLGSSAGITVLSGGIISVDAEASISIGGLNNVDTSIGTAAGAKDITIGSNDGLSKISLSPFRATADAGSSANAAFTANASLVKCSINNLNTTPSGSGSITMTNSTVSSTSGAIITATTTGAGDVQFITTKNVPSFGSLVINYENIGTASFVPGTNVVYLSIMILN